LIEPDAMMVVHKNAIVTIGDTWYESGADGAQVDLLAHYQSATPVHSLWSQEFYTIEVDVTRNEGGIFAGMGKTNRYKISRADKRDKLQYEWWHQDAESVLDEFTEFFAHFARRVGLQVPRRDWLRDYAQAGVLDVSRVCDENGRALCWHTHYRGDNRARLFHSASSYRDYADAAMRSLTGRANRYQHWRDMLRFKEVGTTSYDFGGWYAGENDQDRLRINSFKEEFGGRVVKAFNSIQPVTLRGRAYLAARLVRHPSRRLMHMV
jgi:hypothetical protein